MGNKSLSEFLTGQPSDHDISLSEEEIEAIRDACRSDASIVIEYLEEEKARRERGCWKGWALHVLSWVVGIMTALLTQWLIKLLGL